MRKCDLKSGMIIKTEKNFYGVIEKDRNIIDMCYNPDVFSYKHTYHKILSLDDIYEYDNGKLCIGYIVTEDMKKFYPDFYRTYKSGDIYIVSKIVAIYIKTPIYCDYNIDI